MPTERSSDKPETVLVTGAGGFIGTHLVKRLIKDDINLIVHIGPEDDLTALGDIQAPVIQADITDHRLINSMVKNASTIVHLAGPPSVADSWRKPDYYHRTHTHGTKLILQASIEAKISRFVYVSSAEVYGNPDENPVSETAGLNTASPYGQAKLAAETIVRNAASEELVCFILRPFSIYGPGMTPHSLIGAISEQISTGTEVCLSDLRPVRDYCHVSDLVEAICCSIDFTGASDTYNVGAGAGTSVEQVARMMLDLANSNLPLRQKKNDVRPNDIFELVADTQKIRSMMGWYPRISLRDGLQKLIE